jgi:hypothetical protein
LITRQQTVTKSSSPFQVGYLALWYSRGMAREKFRSHGVVPPDVSVVVHSSSGNATVSGLSGSVVIDGNSGQVQLSNTSGPLQINTGSGNILSRA